MQARVRDRLRDEEEPRTGEVGPPARAWTTRLLGPARTGVVLVLWAVLCELVLKASVWWGEAPVWALPALLNATHLVGVLFLLTVVVWLLCLTGRLSWALTASLALCGLVSIANLVKRDTLLEPVFPFDAHFALQPDALMSNRSWWLATGLLLVFAAALVLGLLVRRRAADRPTPPPGRRPVRRLAARATLALALGLLLVSAVNFNRDELNPWGALVASTDPVWRPWDMQATYQLNGFVAGFLYNMPVEAMERPAGYSSRTVADVARRYEQQSAARAETEDSPNIVIVLSEAFTDPREVSGYSLNEDVIPGIRTLLQSSWSGEVTHSAYGHGTSAAEFEVLTGQAIGLFEPRMTTPYQMLMPTMESYPSVVGWADHRGYRTTAIHPYSPRMYRRIPVYRTLGFDRFLHEEEMTHRARLESNPYISDAAAFREARDQITSSAEPDLVHLVTMQNHFPTDGHYSDPVGVTGVQGHVARAIGGYARGLSHTDAALRDFLDTLKTLEEETVVVFFGDHHPPIYNEEILGTQGDEALRRTPFFIWSSAQPMSHRDLGVVPLTRLLPLAFDRAGITPPAMLRLADHVGREVGAISGGQVVESSGRTRPLESLSPGERQLLADMRLVQYDLSVGRRYGAEQLWR